MSAIFVLCIGVYIHGLFGGFLLDDFSNIVQNSTLRAVDGTLFHWIAATLSSGSGLLRRPVSMLSFALNYYGFGLSPFAFKAVNLAIHLLNGGLIYLLSHRLSMHLVPGPGSEGASRRHQGIALLVTGLWLLHPLHVSAVVYIVQRMNELAALFTLLGLLCYAEGRLRLIRGAPGLMLSLAGLIAFGTLAVFSKENGALVVLYALVIEAICFQFQTPSRRTGTGIKCFFALAVGLPATLFVAYLALHPEWLAQGYAVRDFTFYQRLLTEPRVLFDYLLWIFVPLPSWMGLYHDDIAFSTGLLSPPTTALALVALAALIVLAWALRRRSPGFSFAVAWFLAGHSMESTILPLELVFEHRNYLPMFGVLLGSVSALAPWVEKRISNLAPALSLALLLSLAGLTAMRSATWGDPLRLALSAVRDHPDSARGQYDAGREMIFAGAAKGARREAEIAARPYFLRAMALDATYVFPATSYMLTYAGKGEGPESGVTDLASRLRNTKLFQPNPFLAFLNAVADGKLLLTPDQVFVLVMAALDNPSVSPTIRAMILNNYGRYQFQVLHDAQNAVSLTLAAAELDPGNPFLQVNLTKLAIALERPDLAAEHLRKAEALDVAGLYKQQIEGLKIQLADH